MKQRLKVVHYTVSFCVCLLTAADAFYSTFITIFPEQTNIEHVEGPPELSNAMV